MKKKVFYITVFIALLLAPFFFIFNPEKVEAQQGQMAAVEVLATKVIKKEIEISKELPGRINPFKIAQIRPQVSGIILEKLFKEGSYIQENQQLYEIDPDPFIANLKSAFANLKMAQSVLKPIESRLKRYKELVKTDAVSKQEFEETLAQFENARANILMREAELKKAEIEFDYTKVFSPISGKVGKSYVTQGALVQENQENPMAIVTQLDPIYVDISIPSDDYFKIKNELNKDNIKVQLFVSGQKIPYKNLGDLQFSESIVDEGTGSIGLRSIFQNEELDLLPGLFVNVKLILAKKPAILVPQSATSIEKDGSLSVLAIDNNNVVSLKKIIASQAYENYWIVESGLKENDIIVLEGIQKVQLGSKVKVVFKEIEEKTDIVKKIEEKETEKKEEVKAIKIDENPLKEENYQAKIDKFIDEKIKEAKKDFLEEENFVVIDRKEKVKEVKKTTNQES